MITRTVKIVSRLDGTRHTAELVECPNCEDCRFVVYVVQPEGHLHFQCLNCQETFCDQSCSQKEDQQCT